MQIIRTIDGEKSWMKEELERLSEQLQMQTAAKEGYCHLLLFLFLN